MKAFSKYGAGALALSLLALPGLGRAQEHRDRDLQSLPSPMEAVREIQNTGRIIFMMTDINHDGMISQQEAIDANNLLVGGFFFRADADGNGIVTEQEARAVSEKYLDQNPWLRYVVTSIRTDRQRNNPQGGSQPDSPFQGLMSLIDSNSDKQIQASELRQLVQTLTQSLFAAADTNRDGQMSPSEVNAAAVGAAKAMAQQSFQKADTDNNGQLSRAEFDKAIIEPANTVFQILDLNHDGQLSPQEAQQAERAVLSQVQVLRLPEPANSPTNLLESGRRPNEAAPVPTFTTPNTGQGQNRPQAPQPR